MSPKNISNSSDKQRPSVLASTSTPDIVNTTISLHISLNINNIDININTPSTTPTMPTLETHNGYALWHYIPNRPAAIVFVVLFALMTIFHGTVMIRNRMWFCIPFVIGGFCKFIRSRQTYISSKIGEEYQLTCLSASRNYRLHRPHPGLRPDRRTHPLHPAVHLFIAGAHLLCRHALHDLGESGPLHHEHGQ